MIGFCQTQFLLSELELGLNWNKLSRKRRFCIKFYGTSNCRTLLIADASSIIRANRTLSQCLPQPSPRQDLNGRRLERLGG
jgi:hypothetical protein